MKQILVLHGPNLNLLGSREPEQYGTETLEEINWEMATTAKKQGIEVVAFQSNSEGELVSRIQEARGRYEAIIINAAAYTHTSIAIRDAILAVALPVVEVHLSNIYQRESFRHVSLISDVVIGQVCGFGAQSYLLGLSGVIDYLENLGDSAKK